MEFVEVKQESFRTFLEKFRKVLLLGKPTENIFLKSPSSCPSGKSSDSGMSRNQRALFSVSLILKVLIEPNQQRIFAQFLT